MTSLSTTNGSTLRNTLLGAACAAAFAVIGAPSAVAANVPAWQKGNVVSNLGAELDKLPNTADMKPANGKVKGTNSNYVLTAYSAGTNHPQGLAWAANAKSWIIAHDTRAGYGKSMYAICSTVTDKCSFHFMGKDRHPNGIQVLGDVLAFSVSHDRTYFMDIRDPAAPKRMMCPVNETGAAEIGGAVGIAWEPNLERHVVSIGSGGVDNLFISNGYALDDIKCRFDHVYKSDVDKVSDNDLSAPGEGFSHLYWDNGEGRLVSVGGSYSGGKQQLVYQYFTLKESTANPGTFYPEKGDPVYRNFATAGDGGSAWPGPTLRYGGALRPFGNAYQVVLAPRTLTGGAGMNYMEIDIYPTSLTAQ